MTIEVVRLRFCCPPPHVTTTPARSQSVHSPHLDHSQTLRCVSHGSRTQTPISMLAPPSQALPPFLASSTMLRCRLYCPLPQVTVQMDHGVQSSHRQSTGAKPMHGSRLHLVTSCRSAAHCFPRPWARWTMSRRRSLVPPEQVRVHVLQAPHSPCLQSTSSGMHSMSSLQGLMSMVVPSQARPPSLAWTAMARVREWWPMHVAEQADHGCQSAKRQSCPPCGHLAVLHSA
mmetsp:Transcript_18226/g.47041  ORF Transcript_18226/g.47041 Transcript_18226/m.47041 type:complete len:230 (-) Transcript_18226:566-1255(-)